MTSWEHLSASQRAAGMHDAGPAAVYAGPGSGKTRVVTLRAARLVAQGRRLLVTTFTNDATEEMRSRLKQLLPKERLASAHITPASASGGGRGRTATLLAARRGASPATHRS